MEIEIENVQNTDIGEEEFGENESSESERESSNQSLKLKNGKDLLTEIITRKDGGSKGGMHNKAHMSFYSHVRKMKKANTLAIDSQSNNNVEESINQDLDCVF